MVASKIALIVSLTCFYSSTYILAFARFSVVAFIATTRTFLEVLWNICGKMVLVEQGAPQLIVSNIYRTTFALNAKLVR